MKKFTLISLIIFTAIVGYVYAAGLISKPASVSPTDSGSRPVLTASEIARHSTANDCYLIINNNVYDVSSYIGSHPGGRQIITSSCGTEVSGIFARIHSNRAWDLLAKYKIGMVAL